MTQELNAETKWFRQENGDVLLVLMQPVERGKDKVSTEALRLMISAEEWPHVVAAVGSTLIPEEFRLRAAQSVHAGALVVINAGVQVTTGKVVTVRPAHSPTGHACEACGGGIHRTDVAQVHIPTLCHTDANGRWRCAEGCPVLAAALAAELAEPQVWRGPTAATDATCGITQLTLGGGADACTFEPMHVGRHSWEAPEQELPL